MPLNNNANAKGTKWWEKVVVKRSAGAINEMVDTMTAGSTFLSPSGDTGRSAAQSLVLLDRHEVVTGKMLGKGTYSSVYEITGFSFEDNIDEDDEASSRKFLHQTAIRPAGKSNYAIKFLKPELLKTSKLFEAAAADLIVEAQFLRRLEHPNIVKIHGMAYGGASAYCRGGMYDSYFLVVDRLDETLKNRMTRWKKDANTSKLEGVFEKIDIALQVGSALAYLHERRLVYRDLKPDNIGVIVDAQTLKPKVQLIDYGFVRQLPEPIYSPDFDGPQNAFMFEGELLFHMSGKGTLVYMAPEVLGYRHYNEKVDVFSWAIVLWEMLCLRKPFVITTIADHKKAICERCCRPQIPDTIPEPLVSIIESSWNANISYRLSMKEACSRLHELTKDDLMESNAAGPVGSQTAISSSPISICDEMLNMLVGCANNACNKDAIEALKHDLPVDQNPALDCHSSSTLVLSSMTGTSNMALQEQRDVDYQQETVEKQLDEVRAPGKIFSAATEDSTSYSSTPDQELALDFERLDCHMKRNVPHGRNGTLMYHKFYGFAPTHSEDRRIAFENFLQKMHSTAISQGRERTSVCRESKQVHSTSVKRIGFYY